MEGTRIMIRTCLWLTAALLAMMLGSGSAQENADQSDPQRLNPIEPVKLSTLKAFVERPLFTPERRPRAIEKKAQAVIETPAETDPEFLLLGVTSGPEGSIARIATANSTERRSLREGEVINGWTLEVVGPSSVTLTRERESIVLTIFKGAAPTIGDGREATDTGPGIVFGSEDEPQGAATTSKVRVIDPN